MHQTFDKQKQTLGSRNLLQRLALVASIIRTLRPTPSELPLLAQRAEGKSRDEVQPDLQAELEDLYKRLRIEFAPLAFLYDLRVHGGLAHAPNKAAVTEAAIKLGLPGGNWHRTDYLRMLEQTYAALISIASNFSEAAFVLEDN